MTISNTCDCGRLFFPIGGKYSLSKGSKIYVLGQNNYIDKNFLHNQDVFLSSGELFITTTSKISTDNPLIPQSIIIYLGESFSVTPLIYNSIKIVIKIKETKQIIATKILGAFGSISGFKYNDIVQKLSISIDQNNIHSQIDLNNKSLQVEFYSLCYDSSDICCEKLPSSFSFTNINNTICCSIPAPITTTTTTTPSPIVVGNLTNNGSRLSWVCNTASWRYFAVRFVRFNWFRTQVLEEGTIYVGPSTFPYSDNKRSYIFPTPNTSFYIYDIYVYPVNIDNNTAVSVGNNTNTVTIYPTKV